MRIEITKSVREVFGRAGVDLRSFDAYYLRDGYLCGQSSWTVSGWSGLGKPGDYVSGSLVKIAPVNQEEADLILRLIEADQKEEQNKKNRYARYAAERDAFVAGLPKSIILDGEEYLIERGNLQDRYGNYLFSIDECEADVLEKNIRAELECYICAE